ncbi:hypothetical protein ACFYOD_37305 [Streptomyces sp. NPDC006703]
MPPVEHGTALSAAWGDLSPRDPFDVRLVLRRLAVAGAVFDSYPEDLRTDGDPAEESLPCLLLSPAARLAPFRHEDGAAANERLLRPYGPPGDRFAPHGDAVCGA